LRVSSVRGRIQFSRDTLREACAGSRTRCCGVRRRAVHAGISPRLAVRQCAQRACLGSHGQMRRHPRRGSIGRRGWRAVKYCRPMCIPAGGRGPRCSESHVPAGGGGALASAIFGRRLCIAGLGGSARCHAIMAFSSNLGGLGSRPSVHNVRWPMRRLMSGWPY